MTLKFILEYMKWMFSPPVRTGIYGPVVFSYVSFMKHVINVSLTLALFALLLWRRQSPAWPQPPDMYADPKVGIPANTKTCLQRFITFSKSLTNGFSYG